MGPENFQIEVAEFYVDDIQIYPGGPAIEVDPSVTHSIRARYKVRNNGASAFHYWECCMTVYDVTHGQPVGSRNDHGQGGVSDWKDRTINVGYIDETTVFRVKIRANQDYGASPPPISEW